MIQFNDNPILVDVNSKRSRKEKILCVLCFPKIQLDCINPEENDTGVHAARTLTN